MSICFSDLICAPMDTAAEEEEWGNGKHDSFLCLEVRMQYADCMCDDNEAAQRSATRCERSDFVVNWVDVCLAFSYMSWDYDYDISVRQAVIESVSKSNSEW